MSLPECEDESLNAGIKELDLKTPVLYLAFLADELIQTRLLNLAGAVRGGIRSTIVSRRFAVQRHLEAIWLTVLGRSQHQVQIAAMEPEHNLARSCVEHGGLGPDIPLSAQPPLIQRWFFGWAIRLA